MNHKSVITAKNVTKQFRIRGNHKLFSGIFNPKWKYKPAIQNISFDIKAGEAVAFLGPNGAGKTTTTKMLTGLVYPTDGIINVLGYVPFERNYEFLKHIGLVMGNKAGLNWDLTALQSYELLQKIYEIPIEKFSQSLENLTKLLNVDSLLDTQVRKLSLGERMKLELIGAILHDPEVLFLDEPTIGLDIDSKKNVRDFLKYLHSTGKTLLLTSHDMDDIAEVCERAIVVSKGKIIYDDSMRSLNNKYSHTRYARMEFADKVPTVEYAADFGEVISFKKSALKIGAPKNEIMNVVTKISNEYPIQDITIEQVPLEIIISDLFKSSDLPKLEENTKL